MTRLATPVGSALRLALGTALLFAAIGCGGKSPEQTQVQIPPVSNLREAAETLVTQAELIEEPPSWLNHERDVGDHIYGVGTARAKRDEAQDLFTAMQNGRDIVISWMKQSGLETAAPMGFADDLPIDRNQIQFDSMVYDTRGRKWYVLAVLSKTDAAAEAGTRVQEIDDALDTLKATTLAPRTSDGDRVSSALSLLLDVDRRAQWTARHDFFSGTTLATPEGLDDDALVRLARAVLSEHGVRIIIDGVHIPGLRQVVESALGDVYMESSEFGIGLVRITLEESTSYSAGMELLVLDGLMQMTLDGESGRTFSRPLRAVTTYDNQDAARARIARLIGEEAANATREAILSIAR